MVVMDREVAKLNERVDLVEERVQKLEEEEAREEKERTIRPRSGAKPFSKKTK